MSQATSANTVVKTFTAGGVIQPNTFVKESSGTVVTATVAGAAVGVYIGSEACASGDKVSIAVLGPCKVSADGTSAIAIGAKLQSNASAVAVVNVTAGQIVQGMALEPLASGTAVIEMLLAPHSI